MEVSKSDKECDKNKKVLFTQRLCAYFVDVLIVSIIAGLISTVFIDSDKLNDLTKRLENFGIYYLHPTKHDQYYLKIYLHIQVLNMPQIVIKSSLLELG